jgi:uncharacterized protein
MKWSLLELKKHQQEPVLFDATLDLKDELMKRENQILDLSEVKVRGLLTVGKNEYILHYTADVVITLPSSRSLTPVPLSMEIEVDEVFMTEEQFLNRKEQIEAEEVIILEGQTIDLDESVADNILLAIPIQVLSEEELANEDFPSGNDWEVVSEEQYHARKSQEAEEKIDPRLAKLSELFTDSEE